MRPSDPIEGMVFDALTEAGIDFVQGDHTPERLDFFLPNIGIHIEVKQFHTERISEQMSRAPDVIAIQGRWAAEVFCGLIRNNNPKWASKPREAGDV